jgi:hypothetical protein
MRVKVTCPSAIISKTWYWPPLFSTIVMAISIIGANEVGPVTQIQRVMLGLIIKLVSILSVKAKYLRVGGMEQSLYILTKLLQIHYSTSHLNGNWRRLDHVLMLTGEKDKKETESIFAICKQKNKWKRIKIFCCF